MKALWILIATTLFLPAALNAYVVTGILQGKQEITIKSKSQGQITKVFIKEGEWVKAGAVLALIDDEQEKIEMELAKVEMETARGDLEKMKKLGKYVSAEEVLNKKNAFLKKESLYQLKAYNFKNTRITSPISGLVTKQFIKFGETISSGDKSYEVIQLKKLVIELDVDAEFAGKLKKGQKLGFTSNLHPKEKFTAAVNYVGPVLDKSSGTIRVKLELPNPQNKSEYVLKPGTLVEVQI